MGSFGSCGGWSRSTSRRSTMAPRLLTDEGSGSCRVSGCKKHLESRGTALHKKHCTAPFCYRRQCELMRRNSVFGFLFHHPHFPRADVPKVRSRLVGRGLIRKVIVTVAHGLMKE